ENFSLKHMSGAEWANAFPGSTSTDALNADFKAKLEAFEKSLEGKARVDVTSTLRSPEQQFLMREAWLVAHGEDSPSEADQANPTSSIQAAKQMVAAFGINEEPGETSNHSTGNAVDMNITWWADFTTTDGFGNEFRVHGDQNDKTNKDLIALGKSFGVVHFG